MTTILSINHYIRKHIEKITNVLKVSDDVGRIQRNLLQEDVGDDSLVAEEEEEMEEVTTTTTTTTEGPLENMAGPTRFYHENGKLPKFLMEVKDGEPRQERKLIIFL